MLLKLAAGGVALLAAAGGFGLILWAPSPAPSRGVEIRDTASLVRFLNAETDEALDADADWVIRSGGASHGVLVLEVEAPRLDDAREIATRIVQRLWWRKYQEILIDVYSADPGEEASMRRIQWTPEGGYVDRVYPLVSSTSK